MASAMVSTHTQSSPPSWPAPRMRRWSYAEGIYTPPPWLASAILGPGMVYTPPGRGQEGLYTIVGPRMALARHGGGV